MAVSLLQLESVVDTKLMVKASRDLISRSPLLVLSSVCGHASQSTQATAKEPRSTWRTNMSVESYDAKKML